MIMKNVQTDDAENEKNQIQYTKPNPQTNGKEAQRDIVKILRELKKQKNKIWNLSATAMTRQNSPYHMIPKSKRFSSVTCEKRKNKQFLSVQLRTKLNKGIIFEKSKRKDNFVKKDKQHYPSSATYFRNDNEEKESKIFSDMFANDSNPELKQKLQYVIHSHNQKSIRQKKGGGFKFKNFSKLDKQYVDHGKSMPYQPEIMKDNPGVGKYRINDFNKKRSTSYSMRLVLSRFNEKSNMNPGPGSYSEQQKRRNSCSSINTRGTFQKSKRTYLVNVDKKMPGPGSYS